MCQFKKNGSERMTRRLTGDIGKEMRMITPACLNFKSERNDGLKVVYGEHG